MDYREAILKVFERGNPGRIIWQPRLELWYEYNKRRGTLPRELKNVELIDVYDILHASVRYFTTPLKVRYRKVKYDVKRLENRTIETWDTPLGVLTRVHMYDEVGYSSAIKEFPIKAPEDFKILRYLLEDEEWYFDYETYEKDLEKVGNRGIAQFYFRRSPFQALMIDWMGVEKAILLMISDPQTLDEYLEFSEKADDKIYEVILNSPVKILNLGENIDVRFDSPSIFEKYLFPYYNKRIKQIHEAGKFVHIHVDGNFKQLLPYLKNMNVDGFEALTPAPQGDVTIEEIKENLCDFVLLDGIPAVYLLSHYSFDQLWNCTEKLVELFHPRLILGISDEVPPDTEFERLKLLSEKIRELNDFIMA